MNKYHIITFGCQANTADSEQAAKIMESFGYSRAKDTEDLVSSKKPVLIFNTCSIRQKAEDRIFGLNNKLQRLKIVNYKLKIILTGCMMHYPEKELKKRLPVFDYFIDIKKIKTLPEVLELNKKQLSVKLKSNLHGNKISALVPVSNGCDNFCTYCIVPYTRGREVSNTAIDIVDNVKKKIAEGAKEIWLLGQTVNSYHCNVKDKEIRFPELLRLINSIPGDFWIRFTSPHPKDFSEDLIKAMAECEKFAHYINLPVQSGNNAVLKKMGRPYTADHYKRLIRKIRKAIPDIAISTDIIVGFPGETETQFKDTKKLFQAIKFDMAFISEYSPRPKTAAAKMFKDNISHEEKEKRKNELNEILKKTALENNQKLVGKIVKVLNGRTEGNKPIEIKGDCPKDRFISIEVIKANTWSLKGRSL